jgi:predicted transcriptional regulator of viral defense system
VKKFDGHAVAQRLGFVMEYLQARKKMQVEPDILNDLLSLVGSKVYSLDVKSSKKGEISKKWKIINNAGYLEI